jgi:uncharacterized protein (TIGR00251 family)
VVLIRVKVQPYSKRSEIMGVHDGFLKLRVAAPPVDGAANDAVMDGLSAVLSVRRSAIELLHGATSRLKVLQIQGVTYEMALEKLVPGVRF